MSLQDEIQQVISEEDKRSSRKSRIASRSTRTRFLKPTYFAVILGKLIIFYRGIRKGAPSTTRRNPGNTTYLSIIKRDIRNLHKKIVAGMVQDSVKVPLKGHDESWDDWDGEL